MSRVLRALRARRREDSGLSLTEIVVAMGLTSILLVAVGSVVTSTARATRAADAAASTSADARTGLEILTRSLRAVARPVGETSAVLSGDVAAVTVYTLLNRSGAAQTTDTVPTKVRYSFDGSCVQETTTAGTRNASGPAGFTWTATPQSRCVLRTAVAPAFRYYTTPVLAVNGVDTSPLTVPAGGITDTAVLAQITAIEVTLTARPSGSSAGTQVIGRVTLGNVLSGEVAR